MSIATDLYLLIGISLRPYPSEPSKALVEFAKGVVGTILQDQFEECDHYEVKECGLGPVNVEFVLSETTGTVANLLERPTDCWLARNGGIWVERALLEAGATHRAGTLSGGGTGGLGCSIHEQAGLGSHDSESQESSGVSARLFTYISPFD